MKRSYQSEKRTASAAATRNKILESARTLFLEKGFTGVTIAMIAKRAGVSAPSVYAIFKSKKGVLAAFMDQALPEEEFTSIIEEVTNETSNTKRMQITAKLCRKLYDAERQIMQIMQGAAGLSPELRQLEQEREERRFERQKAFIHAPKDPKKLDLFWALTGRDLYRMLVIERGWSPQEYEAHLAELLTCTIANEKAV